MGPSRVALCRAAYAACKDDMKGYTKGAVKPAHIADRYDTSKHPAVVAGRMDEESAALSVLGVWREDRAALDEEVTIKAFCDRYEWISPLYDDDRQFDEMMRAAWRLK